MKIKALTSFAGLATMAMGEIKEVEDGIAKDLIAAGYAVEFTADKGGKKATPAPVEAKKAPAKATKAKTAK